MHLAAMRLVQKSALRLPTLRLTLRRLRSLKMIDVKLDLKIWSYSLITASFHN
jgi:hypothetical protein